MGYDMYIAGVTKEDKQKASTLRQEARELYKGRKAFQAPERAANGFDWKPGTGDPNWWDLHRLASEKSGEADSLTGYFRLNIWGMQAARKAMDELGMIDWEASHTEDWPDPGDFNLEDWPDPDGEYPEGSPEDLFLKAAEKVRSQTNSLISGYKLCSNDGWIVTPEEIAGSLAKLEVVDGKHVVPKKTGIPEWFGEWVEYLEEAQKRGGFKVW